MAGEFPVSDGRIRLQDAVALAASVRQHVRWRDPVPAAVDVGRDGNLGHALRLVLQPDLGPVPYSDRPAAGLSLHDAYHWLRVDVPGASLITYLLRERD